LEEKMARTGVYVSDVKRARDALVAQGRHPSIDAVRAALGNTGSKTTIHKYLRELEAEEGVPSESVSDTIQTLVSQLAEQLKREAATEAESLRVQMVDQRAVYDRERAGLEVQLAEAGQAIQELTQRLIASEQAGAALNAQLQAEQIARHKSEQHNEHLATRLADSQRHQASLEEKHKHARDSLEHYRSAAKEQREQENRRHEQQVQGLQAELRQAQLAIAVKQEELTRLNREAASLVSDLAATRQALHAEREASRSLARKVEQMQRVESQVAVLETQLTESWRRASDAEQAAARAVESVAELRQQKAVLEVELATAKSAIALDERLDKLGKAIQGAARVGDPSAPSA
jgi:DNA repair exonuclease SbcCD ATPase subunit